MDQSAVYDAMNNLFNHAQEMTVKNLERMSYGHEEAYTPEKVAVAQEEFFHE